jgi:hypothetical protein
MTLDNVVELFQFACTLNAKQIQRGCQFLVRRESREQELSKLPNFDKLTQEQRDALNTFTKADADAGAKTDVADVTMELTPYKFIEKINAGEHERNRRHNGNNNDNNTDSKRCTIS